MEVERITTCDECRPAPRRWFTAPLRNLPVLPALGVALLPKCPLCCAAYLGALSSVGLGLTAEGLRLGLLVLLAAALVPIAVRAGRRGPGPVLLGTLAAAGVLAGKFWFDVPVLLYASLACLVAASVWNSLPRRS